MVRAGKAGDAAALRDGLRTLVRGWPEANLPLGRFTNRTSIELAALEANWRGDRVTPWTAGRRMERVVESIDEYWTAVGVQPPQSWTALRRAVRTVTRRLDGGVQTRIAAAQADQLVATLDAHWRRAALPPMASRAERRHLLADIRDYWSRIDAVVLRGVVVPVEWADQARRLVVDIDGYCQLRRHDTSQEGALLTQDLRVLAARWRSGGDTVNLDALLTDQRDQQPGVSAD